MSRKTSEQELSSMMKQAHGLAEEYLDHVPSEARLLLQECYYSIGAIENQNAFMLRVPKTPEHQYMGKELIESLSGAIFACFRTPFVGVAVAGETESDTKIVELLEFNSERKSDLIAALSRRFECSPRLLSSVSGMFLADIFEELLSTRHTAQMAADSLLASMVGMIDSMQYPIVE